MSNSYYNAGSFPATGTPATSASMRAELALISGGFDRLPALSGNANKLVLINGAETGMTTLTPPAGDLVGTTATQTLTNKTISGTFTGSLTGAASLNVLKAGDTMTGNLVINTGVDSRVLLQSSGTTQGQIQTTGALVRFASNNALPLVLSTNGVDRATLDDVGNITFGSASATGVFKVQGNNTNDLAVFESTDASASAAPDVVLYRNSASPAVSDQIGVLIWRGKDSGGADQQYARLGAEITDPTAGSEDADLWFETTGAGVAAERMRLNAAGLSLASTSDLTLNKGTANGILYLNGSKVATSGSALTFDGANFTTTGYAAGNGIRSLSGNPVRFYNSVNSNWSQIIAPAGTGDMQFDTGAGEQMRLTSTGLGIGASSPGARLDVRGASTDTGLRYIETTTGNLNRIQLGAVAGAGYIDVTAGTGLPSLQLRVASSTKATLDVSGNLGLGVTPGAWINNAKALQISTFLSAWQGSNGSANLGFNVYEGGINTYQYSTTGDAPTMYQQLTGSHAWFSAPGGTAGNTIAFTRVMTLDASGNLGIGVTSISGFRADILSTGTDAALRARSANSSTVLMVESAGTSSAQIRFINTSVNNTYISAEGTALTFLTAATERMRLDSSGNLGIGVTPSATSSPYKSIELFGAYWMGGNNTTPASYSYTNAYFDGADKYKTSGFAASLYRQLNGTHAWFTAPSGTAGNAITFTQSMTLDASGNLGVGTTSSGARLHINSGGVDEVARFEGSGEPYISLYDNGVRDFYLFDSTEIRLWGQANKAMVFATNNTERARITSGGDLLVGTTDAAQTSGAGFKVGGAGGIGVGQVAIVDADSTNSTVTYRLYSTGAAAYRFYVGLGGTIYATSATITSLSDQRLKENIQNIDVGLNAIMALKPRKFDWKAGKGKDIKGDRGFIAQEFEQVFPDMVDTWQDPAPEGEEPYKAVNADLIPVLVKAMQEQQALITALTARVAQLERQA